MILPKATAQAIQAAEAKDNHLPSPPSILINGRWTNVCPRCHAPSTTFPWRCTKCAWTAATDPRGCCTAIHDVVPDAKDATKASYPVTVSEIEAAKAASKPTEKQKAIASLSTATADVPKVPAQKESLK